MRSFVLIMGMLAVVTSEASAFEFQVTRRSEPRSGNVQFAYLDGTYKLAANETLSNVQIVYNIGSAAGQFSPTSKTWSVGVGDFALKSYRVEFTVKRNGQKSRYVTPTYTVGK